MVWDPNQEGYIGKFGGKILLSAKKHYLNGKKHKKKCCMHFNLFKYVYVHINLYRFDNGYTIHVNKNSDTWQCYIFAMN